MANGESQKEGRIAFPSSIINVMVSSVLGAVLGGTGATYWQAMNPKVEAFTSSKFEAFRENDLRKLTADIWANTQHIAEHGNKIDWIARQLGECEKYRDADDAKVEKLSDRIKELEYVIRGLRRDG